MLFQDAGLSKRKQYTGAVILQIPIVFLLFFRKFQKSVSRTR